jgi:hypothetical protein
MGDIKSALELAMEKVAKLEGATEEERLGWKYTPEGEKLATRYLKGEFNLVAELARYEENVRGYVAQGASEVLIRNISLPRSDSARGNNRRAMEGLKVLKRDAASVENVYSKMRRIFDHYQGQGEQQRKQAYQALKADFETKVQQAMQQQLGPMMGVKIDVERQPQFQEEWRRVLAQLDSQYNTLLEDYKRELSLVT